MIPQPIDTVPLFQRLAEEERQLVTARLKRRQAQPGEMIVVAGEASDTLYIITNGWVKIEGGNAVTLANLGAGGLIGESDVMSGAPYSMTARVAGTTPTQLLALARADLEELISDHPSIGLKFSASLGLRIAFLDQYLIQSRLRHIELLSALHEDDLRAIAQQLGLQQVTRGDMIIETGMAGDAAYLVEAGNVRLIQQTSEGEVFEELGAGDLFGHTALITGKPHNANVRAISDASLWVLPRTAYTQLIQERPAIKLAFSRALSETLTLRDQADAMERMRQLDLFTDVPTSALTALAARLVLRHFPGEEAIYTEGTPGDAMYIVESGEIKLLDSAFSDARLLERLHTGEAFGEMALLTGRTRAECARAASDTIVWVLYKSDFDDVMVQYPEISLSLSRALTERLAKRENDFVVRHLRRINLFAHLATSELKEIAKKVHGLRFRPGEIICFAHQPVQSLYLIEFGEVKRMVPGPNGEPISFEILDSGDSFGEQEIVQGLAHATTAQALGEVELWTIAKNDFQAMLESYPALTLMITRRIADRLARAQQRAGQPRINPYVPTQPAVAPHPAQPPAQAPARRIQQPLSGARPVNPPTHRASVSSVAHTRAAVAPAPSAPHRMTGGTAHAPHNIGMGVARSHNAPHMQAPVGMTQPAQRIAPPARAHHHEASFTAEFGAWATGLSLGAKLRVLTLGLLFVWFALIVLPATTVTAVSSAMSSASSGSAQAGGASSEKAGTTERGRDSGPLKVAFAVASPTPLPTRTPAPTFTPRPQPTAVRIVPTKTPPPPVVAAAPTAAPLPALPPPEIDPRLVPGSGKTLPLVDQFKIIPANVARGQKFWRITKVVWEDITESGNDHSIYVMLKDEGGKRAEAKIKAWYDGDGGMDITNTLEQKSASDMCNCNYGIGMYGGAYGVQINEGIPSDQATGMIMPMRRHVNYKVYYQLTTMP